MAFAADQINRSLQTREGAKMGGLHGLVTAVVLTGVAFVILAASGPAKDHHFCGGTMNFEFVDWQLRPGKTTYTAMVTVVTGWVLGQGPCGPSCSASDVGQLTRQRRLQTIQSKSDPEYFGDWVLEKQHTLSAVPVMDNVTDYVNRNITGRVSMVSEKLQWEQEIANFDIEIDPANIYTDIEVSGSFWKEFTLNGKGDTLFHIQSKVRPQIRNDTGRPNSSPIVLYKPMYRIQLNNVTQIRLSSIDQDGDFVTCRDAEYIERNGLKPVNKTTVRKDCVVVIDANEAYGFKDGDWGVITFVLEDFNRQSISMEGKPVRGYLETGISSTVVHFMIEILANLTQPEFVDPTLPSQHMFTVYVGSLLSIPLFARPSPSSPLSTTVTGIQVQVLKDHPVSIPSPTPDTSRAAQRVVQSRLQWRTQDEDAGYYIVMAVAVDSDGFESMDRSYVVYINPLRLTAYGPEDDRPYFPFLPGAGDITCQVGSTCSFPVYVGSGSSGHKITSVSVISERTEIPGTECNHLENVTFHRKQVYRADINFTSELLGNRSVCLRAVDDRHLEIEKCLNVTIIPPNPCDSGPCRQGSTCVPRGIEFKCICPPGYTSLNCSAWLDPCSSNPCKNGGHCVSNQRASPTSFVCTHCDLGFTGKTCETNIDDCTNDACGHNGVCVDEVHNFRCECAPGYSGSNCSISSPECTAYNCPAQSVCTMVHSKPVCRCPLGQGGDHCQTDTDVPLNSTVTLQQPHAVVPTLRPGTQVSCDVGTTCLIPLYITGNLSSLPVLHRGTSSPEIATVISSLVKDNTTGTAVLTSSLSVKPEEKGDHHVCIDILDHNTRYVEQLCYLITSRENTGATPPPIPKTGGVFAAGTPPDGTTISCHVDLPCHIIAQTRLPTNKNCTAVRPALGSAVVFKTTVASYNTCSSDVLLTPTSSSQNVCLAVGIGGERRCYHIETVNNQTDACKSNPCLHNGVCLNKLSESDGYVCVCPVPYKGKNCDEAGDCQDKRCLNDGVCISDSPGYHCDCQPGYAGDDCRYEPEECKQTVCQENSVCLLRDSQVHCECPPGQEGSTCRTQELDVPLNMSAATDKPHLIVPTPEAGLSITCDVGSTCQIPVYYTGSRLSPPTVSAVLPTPGLTSQVSFPQPDSRTGARDSLKSVVSVTPSQAGQHHVCVEIQSPASGNSDSVCYIVSSQQPQSSGLSTAANTGFTASPGVPGGVFALTSPPAGSQIVCHSARPCRFIAYTDKPASGSCVPVRSQAVGVYAFETFETDPKTCATNVLIDPQTLGRRQACVEVGFGGERRCYVVAEVDDTNDTCFSNPCMNGGKCINTPHSSPPYVCACPSEFPVLPNCDEEIAACAAFNCSAGSACAVMKSQPLCLCALGTGGDKCQSKAVDVAVNGVADEEKPHTVVPTLPSGMQISCDVGQTCQIPIYLADHRNSTPEIHRGPSSPQVATSFSPLVKDNATGIPALTSSMSVTPQQPGDHHVCFDVMEFAQKPMDQICYLITSRENGAQSTTPSTSTQTKGSRFAAGTPLDGAAIVCHDDRPCHLIARTTNNSTGNCNPVRPVSGGAFVFKTNPNDQHSCGSDVLLAPSSASQNVCIAAGSDGETRCFHVQTVNHTYVCRLVNPCLNDGICISQPANPDGYICSCLVPYKGRNCSEVGDCRDQRCLNNAVCIDVKVGFRCDCQPGYQGEDCRYEPAECRQTVCHNGSVCLLKGSQAHCECQPGRDGTSCQTQTFDIPVNKGAAIDQAHAIVPTAPTGLNITCYVGSACSLPVYLTRSGSGAFPAIATILSSPALTSSVSPPYPSNITGFADGLKSVLSVIPTHEGQQHVCVEITGQSSEKNDTVCYVVNSLENPGITAPSLTSTWPSASRPESAVKGRFTDSTPLAGSQIVCHSSRPCRVIAHSDKPSSGLCAPVRPLTVGLYLSQTSDTDSTTCGTEVLIDPDVLGIQDACLEVGFGGEQRCYKVSTVDDHNDPCDSYPCKNGGRCINTPQASPPYVCACPAQFSTAPNCDTEVSTDATSALPQHLTIREQSAISSMASAASVTRSDASSTLAATTSRVAATALPVATPALHVCDTLNCSDAAVCTLIHSKPVCLCPLGLSGKQCRTKEEDVPVNPGAGQLKPHAVVPTLPSGMQITCDVGQTCQVPLYIMGNFMSPLSVIRGPSSPNLVTSISPPVKDNVTGIPVLTSFLFVTPQDVGDHHACVDIVGSKLDAADHVCYLITSLPNGTFAVPTANSKGVSFSVGTPPDGATIVCHEDIPCHIIALTEKNSTGNCIPVQPASTDVFVFKTNPSDQHSCGSDVLVAPANISQNVCITVGPDGESRCYKVETVNPTSNRCQQGNPCFNNGICISKPTRAGGFVCACSMLYTGANCSEENQAMPLNKSAAADKPHAIMPTMPAGLNITCFVGSTCRVPVYLVRPPLGNVPVVSTSLSSPGLTSSVSDPHPDNITDTPQGLRSTLSVSPKQQGQHHVCVEIKDQASFTSDAVCYLINSIPMEGLTSSGQWGSTPLPTSEGGSQFTDSTPPRGSHMVCHSSRPCRFVAHTEKPANAPCIPVQSQSSGVYSFETLPIDSSTCGTSMLIDPVILAKGEACIQTGSGGEKRCYAVVTVDDTNDPCDANPCHNGGKCINTPPSFVCACPVQYAAEPNCDEKAETSSIQTSPPVTGAGLLPNNITAIASTSLTPAITGTIACGNKTCQANSVCKVMGTTATCLCPLGQGGDRCDRRKVDNPLNSNISTLSPHTVLPTPRTGMRISCGVGETCQIPLYIAGNQTSPATVHQGPSSPGLTTSVSPPAEVNAAGIPLLMSTLSVTPSARGDHHVCVDVMDTVRSETDRICYIISSTSTVRPGGTVPMPSTSATEGHFAAGSPPDGATISCHDNQPCHILALTQMTPSGTCIPVQTRSNGVVIFQTSVVTSSTCGSDVLFTPDNSSQTICLGVGNAGYQRCYKVETVSNETDPCAPNPCANNGVCVADSRDRHGHTCACPVPFQGTDCTDVGSCTVNSSRCLNKAVCLDLFPTSGFRCDCQPGYHGDDCRYEPEGCYKTICQGNSVCLVEANHTQCVCQFGWEGSTCQIQNTDIPSNSSADLTKAHIIIPTAGNGLTISCEVGDTCSVPVFVTGSSNPQPTVSLASPGVNPSISNLFPVVGTQNSQQGTLMVTPTESGQHHVCVQVKDGASQSTDNVCFLVNSHQRLQDHTVGVAYTTGSNLGVTRISANQGQSGRFTSGTPGDGSTIVCFPAKPCRLVAITSSALTGDCVPVRSQVVGVYTFETTPYEGSSCSTDLLVEPSLLGASTACVTAGFEGERRCFRIATVQDNPCEPNPCQHGGLCINTPLSSQPFKCACPTEYPLPALCEKEVSSTQIFTSKSVSDILTSTSSASGPQFIRSTNTMFGLESRQSANTVSVSKLMQSTNTISVSGSLQSRGTTSGSGSQKSTDTTHGSVSIDITSAPASQQFVRTHDSGSQQSTDITSASGSQQSTDIASASGSQQSADTTSGSGSQQSTDITSASGSQQSTDITSASGSQQSTNTTSGSGSQQSTDTTSGSGSQQSTSTTSGSRSQQSTDTTSGSGSQQSTDTTFGSRYQQSTDTTLGSGSQQSTDTTSGSGSQQSADTSGSGSQQSTSTSGSGSQQSTSTTFGSGFQQSRATTSDSGSQQSRDTTSGSGSQQSTSTKSSSGSQQSTDTTSGSGSQQSADTTSGSGSQQPTGTTFASGQCAKERQAFTDAAKEGSVRCTCYHPVTKKSHDVIRPRVSNERLLRAGGIGAGTSVGLIALGSVIYFMWRPKVGSTQNVNNSPKAYHARRHGKGGWVTTPTVRCR